MALKFIVDEMMGKLARLLRMAGFDTLYHTRLSDDQLLQIAQEQGRLLITRDKALAERASPIKVLHISSTNPFEQFRQVVASLKLNVEERAFERCLECNSPLRPMKKEDCQRLVPPRVFEFHHEFYQCPKCHKIYWPGTHYQSMKEKLARLSPHP